VAAATLGSATLPPEWSAVSWQAGSIVTHEGHLYRATQLAPGGHVPGASTRWERFDLPTVWDRPAPAPALALDDLTDVDAPADTPVGGLLAATGTGRWAVSQRATETTVASTARTVQGLSGKPSLPSDWSATTTYNVGDVVHHQGSALFRSALPNNVNHEPSYLNPSAWWERFDLAAVADRADRAWIRWAGTQAEYDAIDPKNTWTLYVITS
jgi:hypothetical protein